MIVNFEDLPDLRKDNPDSITFCSGCFDLFHPGHIQGLEFAKSQGNLLAVGIQPDRRVKEMKGPTRPIQPEFSRMAVVNALACVDYTFIMPIRDPNATSTMKVIRALNPDVFAIHEDNAGPWNPEDIEYIESMGTRLVIDRSPKMDSTTDIIARIACNQALIDA